MLLDSYILSVLEMKDFYDFCLFCLDMENRTAMVVRYVLEQQ